MPDCEHTKTRLIRLTDETKEFVKWVLHCDFCKVLLWVFLEKRRQLLGWPRRATRRDYTESGHLLQLYPTRKIERQGGPREVERVDGMCMRTVQVEFGEKGIGCAWVVYFRYVSEWFKFGQPHMVTSKTNAYPHSKFKHSKFSFHEAFVVQTNTGGLLP